MSDSRKTNNRIQLLLKTLFVAGLLFFLGRKGFISIEDTHRAFRQWHHTAPAFGVMILTTLLGVIRWQILLKAQGIQLPLMRVFQLNMMGGFFNIALPGAVSGDFVKAFYIGREIEGQRARAFGSILFDRVAGLSALVLVSAFAFSLGTERFPALRLFVIATAIGVLAFYSYLFLVREHHDPLLKFFKWVESRAQKAASVTRVYESLRHYHDHRWAVLRVLLISLVVHLMIGWVFLQFAEALGSDGLPLLSLYVIVPLGLLVTAVPVLPAGVGTGHAAFFYLFSQMGFARGADVFTLFALGNIVLGAVGGLIYLRFRSHEPRPAHGLARIS